MKGHGYTDLAVRIGVELYANFGCGLEKTSAIMGFLNGALGLGMDRAPCPNTVKNWVLKTGLSIYREAGRPPAGQGGHALVVDESMMVGSERLLLTLSVGACKPQGRANARPDVEVADISVAPSWSGAGIAGVLAGLGGKLGAPAYVVSDNASVMAKAVRLGGHPHVRDVGHTLAMFVERAYKHGADFAAFARETAQACFTENMKAATAYLAPPTQRTVARFMNLAPVVAWASRMLDVLDTLPPAERLAYGFLRGHAAIIGELSVVMAAYGQMCRILKADGLSPGSVEGCGPTLALLLCSPHPRARQVGQQAAGYLQQGLALMDGRHAAWHCSSDMAESLFSAYKRRQACNKRTGVTTLVLLLPVLTKIHGGEPKTPAFYREKLEATRLRQVRQWASEKLTPNAAVERRNVLKTA